MCLIIVAPNPQQNPLTHNEVRRAIEANPDGWGFAALYKNGSISVKKGFGIPSAWDTVKKAQSHSRVVVFHARIATSGDITESQCHPYTMHSPTGEKRFLFHNGVLQGIPMPNPYRSDTWHLAQTLKRYESTPALLEYLDAFAKRNLSRFVVLSPEGFFIANKASGTMQNGKWHSGYSALYDRKKITNIPPWWKDAQSVTKQEERTLARVVDIATGRSETRLALERETDVLDVPENALQSDEEFIRWCEATTTNANDSIRHHEEGNS